ncbi:MAG: 30S ribosomal protein S6 [Flavobacteriales bacterium AspAUS03]
MLENVYETMIVITPVLSDAQYQDVAGEYESFLKNNDAQIRHKERWGLKRLAYTIKKKQSGWYSLLEYEVAPSLISELELRLERDERVICFITVKLDKDAIKYTEKRRKEMQLKKEKQLN